MRTRHVLVALLVVAISLAGTASLAGAAPNESSCWGQASQAFARDGLMGEHASSFETPRLGLRNLARALHDQGVLDDDSMQSLGAFVADELGYEIEACE